MPTNALWQIDPDSKKKFEAALKNSGPDQREWPALRRDAEQLALMRFGQGAQAVPFKRRALDPSFYVITVITWKRSP
ncbi:MAG: hypothetical protein ABJB74_10505 [Gemmatimonas sp.]